MSRHLRLKHPKSYRTACPYLDKTPIKGPLKSTSWVKGSWGRKYCQRVGGTKYKCNLCTAVLSLSNGMFGNMKRHIKAKHFHVYEKEVGGGRSDDEAEYIKEDDACTDPEEYLTELINEKKDKKLVTEDEEGNSNSASDTELPSAIDIYFLNEDDPEFETKVKYLVTKQVEGRRRAKNCFWNFFNVTKENHLYKCLACNRQIAIFPHNIANLKRHIRMRHKYQYSIMMKYMAESDSTGNSSPISFDKYYFIQEGENDYKCKECDIVVVSDEDQVSLFDHIKDTHPDQIMAYQEETIDDGEINNEVVQSEDYRVDEDF